MALEVERVSPTLCSLFPVACSLFPGELSFAQFASYTILFSALMYARMEAPMMSVEMPLPE